LDIVAMDGDVLVLAEVRSRQPGDPPEASLGPRKVARLRRAAREYLIETASPDIGWRFDLVALEGDEIRHVPGVVWD
jgi:Holliday junction resolvase-like predicted endonuclease